MSQRDYTPYQRDAIARYYDHRDEIMLAKVGEIATELYLADSDSKRKRLWSRAEAAMRALKVGPKLMEHILSQQKPEILAANLRDWLAAAPKKGGSNPPRR